MTLALRDAKYLSFKSDIHRIYEYLESQNETLWGWYSASSYLSNTWVKDIILDLKLQESEEMALAILERFVALKNAPFKKICSKIGLSEDKIENLENKLLQKVIIFHTKKHKELLDFIQEEQLLTPFWREMLQLTHNLGVVFNDFFIQWNKEVILTINKELEREYLGNTKEILKVLENTMDVSLSGKISDRSYSVAIKVNGAYKSIAYSQAFVEIFENFKRVFEEGLSTLESIEEVVGIDFKSEHIAYFKSLKNAMLQKDTKKLLNDWRMVDKTWLKLHSPIQIGHPLEYYEDRYRKSVAPEWDVRIATYTESTAVNKDIFINFFQQINSLLQTHKNTIYNNTLSSLKQTQTYGGLPLLFYGSEFNGLFSAQVVPNDETISQKFGKKIFYYPIRIWRLANAKPKMLLESQVFPLDFLVRYYTNLKSKDFFINIYEISTLGHEFGHILWVEDNSELIMNSSGEFKNIEEFKATTGGLICYFWNYLELNCDYLSLQNLQQQLLQSIAIKRVTFNNGVLNDKTLQAVLDDLVMRSIKLIAWKEEEEVLPYYCEGLIHLHLLFESGFISFEDLQIHIHIENFSQLIVTYFRTYLELAQEYLSKNDAKKFLDTYIIRDNRGNYVPKNSILRDFSELYYKKYCEIGLVTISKDSPLLTRLQNA